MNNLQVKNVAFTLEMFHTAINGMDVSKTTRDDYRARIHDFVTFTEHTTIDGDILLNYKRELEKRVNLAVASKNKYLAAARVCLKELFRKGVLILDVTSNVKQFKQTKSHRKIGHTEEEARTFLAHVDKLNPRDRALFYVLFFQGLRQVEVVRLEHKDLDLEKQTALIRGKGRDDKEVIHLHPKVVEVLKDYSETIFPIGRVFDMCERTIRNIYNEIAKKLGIEKTLHGSRKFFITQMIKALNGNLDEAIKWSRHSSFDMLLIYNDDVKTEKSLPVFHDTFNKITA